MISFTLNGKPVDYAGDPKDSLLSYLREKAGLISVKDGCSGQAACGACLVELAGKPAFACVTPMKKVEGKELITLEGFPEEVRRALGRAFVQKGAVQCGFCTPGIITRAKILLQANPDPSREEVVKSLKAHVCRCTGYQRIVDAVLEAAAALRENREVAWEARPGIGVSYPKVEAYDKALGKNPFIDDMRLENMAHGAILFSEHPRARVLSLDFSQAQAMPGVLKVITAEDIPGRRHQGLIVKDWPMYVKPGETTRYIGDALCAVVAKTDAHARDALKHIQVEYKEMEPLTDPMQAENSRIKVHEGGNLLKKTRIKRGDEVQRALDESAHVVSGTFTTPFVEHAFLETEASIALPTDEGIRVYSQSQGIFNDREQIASILDLPEEKVDVALVSAGGAFGGKEDLTVQHHAALAASLLKRPVKFRLTRPESIRMHPKRHATNMRFKVGCDDSGRLTALWARIVGDTGAYASVGGEVVARTGTHAGGAYHFPCVDVEASAYYTNNIPAGAFRGFGVNQSNFALESMLDELCKKGGFDPWQFRYGNALDEGRLTTTGQKLGKGVGLRKCLEELKPQYEANSHVGLACALKNCGIGNGLEEVSETRLTVLPGPKIQIAHGWCEMGQGVHTIARQVLCEVAGLDASIDIEVLSATRFGARGGTTTASRGTMLLGNSMIKAARKLSLDLEGNSLDELVGKEYFAGFLVDWTTDHNADGEIISHFAYGFAAHLAILDDKGNLAKIVAAHDAGRVINPALFDSQVEGGVVMGMGYALSEKLELQAGRLKSERMAKLGLPRVGDVPELEVIEVECPDPLGPFGAKGVGEIGTIPTAPAIANAFSAYDGMRRYDLPLSPVKKK
jgi:aldehyde oxidoreductase